MGGSLPLCSVLKGAPEPGQDPISAILEEWAEWLFSKLSGFSQDQPCSPGDEALLFCPIAGVWSQPGSPREAMSHSFGGSGSVRPGLRRGGLAPGWLAGAVLRTRLCQHCQGVSSSHPAVGSLSPWPVLPHPSLPHHPPLPIGSVLCFLSLVTNFGGEGTARVTAPSCATSTETQETHGGTFLLFPHLEIVHRLFW